MNTSERLGILQRSSKNFPGRATVTVSLEIVGLFLRQGIKSEAGVSSRLCFLFFFQAKWAVVGGSSGQVWQVGILWGQSMPIQNINKPLPDFFCQTKDRLACWEGSRRAQYWKRSQGFSILWCWASRFFPALKFCVKERGGQAPTGEEAFTTWLNLILPHHWDRHHWDRF